MVPVSCYLCSIRTASFRLGAAVKIEHGPKGGRVVIRYHGLEELEGILAHIK